MGTRKTYRNAPPPNPPPGGTPVIEMGVGPQQQQQAGAQQAAEKKSSAAGRVLKFLLTAGAGALAGTFALRWYDKNFGKKKDGDGEGDEGKPPTLPGMMPGVHVPQIMPMPMPFPMPWPAGGGYGPPPQQQYAPEPAPARPARKKRYIPEEEIDEDEVVEHYTRGLGNVRKLEEAKREAVLAELEARLMEED